MDRNEAIELLKNMHWSIMTKMNREVPSSLALLMAIEALGKDTNVPSKSALDHIHNVVRDDSYRRGYEQGKKDATPKWIPVSDRPPEEEGHYLVTDEAAGMTEAMIDEYMCCDDGEWTWLYSQHAIAWMPLPEPWKGE